MNNQIVANNLFNKYHFAKKSLKQSVSNIKETIDKNTVKEKKDIDIALKNYNNKIKKIMQSQTIKNEENNIKKANQIIKITMEQAENFFIKGCDRIDAMNNLEQQEKIKYKQMLFEKISKKLYTDDEMKKFNSMFSNIMVIIPKNGIMGGGMFSGDMIDNRIVSGDGISLRKNNTGLKNNNYNQDRFPPVKQIGYM